MVVVRDAVSKDIGSVPEIPLADFLKHFMPPPTLTEQELNTVFKKLHQKWRPFEKTFTADHILAKKTRAKECSAKHAPLMTDKKGQTCWTDYVNTPAKRNGGEKAIFGDLADISLQIAKCALEVNPNLKRTTKLETNGSRTLKSEKLNPSMPDGVHRLLAEHGGMFDWDSCVCTEEYNCRNVTKGKLDEEAMEAVLNTSQNVLWNMNHTMRIDARRRNVLAMSYSDTEVRLWHCDRSVVVVSAAFHLNIDASIIIDVYSRLIFAALVDLGYDPTIELRWSWSPRSTATTGKLKRKRYYRILVSGVAYITVGSIADQGTDHGFGRCTRVWRAYKEGESKQRFYAIKDCWPEAGSTLEVDIYCELMTAIRAFDWKEQCNPPPAKRRHLRNYDSPKLIDPRPSLTPDERTKFFVTILAGEKLKIDQSGTVDNTQEVIARGYKIPANRKMYAVWSGAVLNTTGGPTLTGVVGNEHLTDYPVQRYGLLRGAISAREHHRSVMEEGTPLKNFVEAKRIFEIVTDVAYALFVMHCVGRVYRDISFNNILAQHGQGVLADLEYVVSQSATDMTCMRMGTADFAAVEVVAGKYTPVNIPNKNWMYVADAEDESSDDEDTPPPPDFRKMLPPWTYRDVHDLESIWWLAVWLLFRHTTNLQIPDTYNGTAQDEQYSLTFPHYYFSKSEDRTGFLRYPMTFATKLDLLPPAWKTAMGSQLCTIRGALMEIYEKTPVGPIPPVIWYMVHNMCVSGQRIEGKFILNAKDAKAQPTQPVNSTIATHQSQDPTLGSIGNIGGKRSHNEALGTNADGAGAGVDNTGTGDAGANDTVVNGGGGHDAAGADVGAAEQSQEARTKRRRLRRTNTEPRRSERLASKSRGQGATR
ncbi:hypothetical protein BD626DRAFT_629638 [Schizophyllum amplum]|uniref:Fungal-type protein kinase domain-containing protein n=1 Tax=Schizophyllum amplum TaxID=97359 RepID=A0A550CGC4_9AGAR|nr:hypothetical protein BD626DRAFT_629638 [Auriculariopsis ampla]